MTAATASSTPAPCGWLAGRLTCRLIAFLKLEQPEAVQKVHVAALWVAGGALVAKELLFRYMLSVAKRVKSSMLVANAWHARSDAASSLVVGVGIIGNLAGYPILDPIAAPSSASWSPRWAGSSAGTRCTT